LNAAVFFIAAKVILFACFVTYILDGGTLTPEVVFVTMSMYNAIRVPVTRIFPNAVGLSGESLVALQRVNQILLLDEKEVSEDDDFDKTELEKGHLKFENYTGKWTKNIPIDNLVNINCHVVPGELLIVVGSVGAGKTCLLYAILNEITKVKGSCRVNGSISYAHQGNWCIGSTIKQNILMGAEYDAERYNEVIHACGLKRDLELFDNGDETFVGEKGFNLSGGQKARVTLARAVYRDSDVYLLDDPLSAVDPKIANHIFVNVSFVLLFRHEFYNSFWMIVHQREAASKQDGHSGDAPAAVPKEGRKDHGPEAGSNADLWSIQ
jgi:ATP-binding cassette subfamily C (CFTR/MRP) protein 4